MVIGHQCCHYMPSRSASEYRTSVTRLDEVLTAANLEQVYRVKVHIGRNPVTSGLAIFTGAAPLPGVRSS